MRTAPPALAERREVAAPRQVTEAALDARSARARAPGAVEVAAVLDGRSVLARAPGAVAAALLLRVAAVRPD